MPVVLRRRDGHDKLQVVSGFRRLTAVKQIGWLKVTAFILDDVDDESVFRLSVLENEKRKTYSDLDRAYAITRYRQMGYRVGDIAKDVFGLSRRQIERLQKLTELPAVVQDAIAADAITATHAVVLKQLLDKYGSEKIDLVHWIERANKEGLAVEKLKREVKKHVAGEGERLPPALFRVMKGKKAGSLMYRLNPTVIVPDSMSARDLTRIATELRRLLELIEPVK